MPYNHSKNPEARRAYLQAYRKSYDPVHREQINLRQKVWRDAHPEMVRQGKKRYYEKHHDERLAYNARWRAENPEKANLATKHWREQHRDVLREYYRTRPKDPALHRAINLRHKARKRAATLEPVNLQTILNRDQGICQICGLPIKAYELSFDHIIPLAKGGNHTEENLQLAHRVCNSRKGATLILKP